MVACRDDSLYFLFYRHKLGGFASKRHEANHVKLYFRLNIFHSIESNWINIEINHTSGDNWIWPKNQKRFKSEKK